MANTVEHPFAPQDQLYKHPDCFTPEENNPYPLCIGNNSPDCNECCLYVNMYNEGGLE